MWLLRTALIMTLAGCASASGTALPDGAAVLPGSEIADILRQCSRGAPTAGESSWQPDAAAIAALEAALPAALAASRARDEDWSRFPDAWLRQYVGIVRGGRRYVYGNLFPRPGRDEVQPERWRSVPVMVCDGGPPFFGVEYDVDAGRVTRLDFNGAI